MSVFGEKNKERSPRVRFSFAVRAHSLKPVNSPARVSAKREENKISPDI
jgi:hypothetical protein